MICNQDVQNRNKKIMSDRLGGKLMWEFPLYLILAPVITIIISLVSSIKFKRYVMAPVILFIVLNIPTILMPLLYNIGWQAMFGWAMVYTIISATMSFIVWYVKRKKSSSRSI